MMISYQDFLRLLTDVSECNDLDSYIAEVGGSVPLDDVDEALKMLTMIWHMGHTGLTIKSLSAACDVSVRGIALQYGLPTRTVENWASGDRTPPEWQLPLIAYAVMSDSIKD